MYRLIFKLALAHIFKTSTQKNISFMIKLCFVALTTSTFALTLVVAVMNGFQKETAAKLQGIHADIIIKAPSGALDYERLIRMLKQEFPDLVRNATPQAFYNVLIRSEEQGTFSPLSACIGIDPAREGNVTTLFSSLNNPESPETQLADNHILLGATAATLLQVRPGDPLKLLYTPQEPHGRKITLREADALVGGTFETGIDEFDSAVIFCNLDFFKKTFSESDVTQIAVACQPGVSLDRCARQLKARLPELEVFTWKDLYPALVAALALEKYAAFIILALCALVAAMNCLALIFMYITQKNKEIAILKTLRMPDWAISRIFLMIGLLITFASTSMGILLAIGAGFLIQRYPLVTLPDTYYVDHLPVLIDAPLIAAVVVTMLLLGLLASYIPSRRVHTFSVAHLLKFGAD